MKTKFSFTDDLRAVTLIPDNELEALVLNEIASRADKGQTLEIKRITHAISPESKNWEGETFSFEMKVNGH